MPESIHAADVWLLDNPATEPVPPSLAARCIACLDDGERERLAAIVNLARRREYLLGHALARVALSATSTDIAPQRWRMVRDVDGRPRLAAAANARGLEFSVAHTTGLVAVAVARGRMVGLDVEHEDRRVQAMALAARFFSAIEVAALSALPEQHRPARFLWLWTLKEAYLKARGAGLRLPLGSISIEAGDAEPGPAPVDVLIRFAPPVDDDPARWSFHHWRSSSGHVLALACTRPAGERAARSRLRIRSLTCPQLLERLGGAA